MALLSACGTETTATPDARVSDARLDGPPPLCANQRALSGGIACAIAPGTAQDGASDAFGYHAIAIPDSAGPDTPFYVHFKGTGSMPFDPAGGVYVGSTLLVLQEAIDHGRIGLVISYDGNVALEVICGDDLDCYGAVRREILEGIEAGDPGDVKHVRPPDDVFSRVDALVAFIHGLDAARFPASLDWSKTRVGGGSQGGGLAAYLAKAHRAVAWSCNLAGLGDSDSLHHPATWVTAPDWMTPLDRMRAVIHQDDPYYARTIPTWMAFGYVDGVNRRTLTGATNDPHGYVVSAEPEAAAARRWACFDP